MAERRDILFRLLGDSRSLQRATRTAQSSLGSITDTLRKVAGVAGIAFGVNELVNWGREAINMAAAAAEVDSKFQAVFGSAKDFNDELLRTADLAGVTDTNARNLAATFGNLAQAQGISKESTMDLTAEVFELAGDLASFNDANPAQVFENLTKGILTTEREGLKPLGIAISEMEVKQRALAIAVADGRDEATKADRAYASYQIAVEQAGKAIGDLERTSDSAANKQRRLNATLEETQEAIGKRLLPSYELFLDTADRSIYIIDDVARGLLGMGAAADEATEATRRQFAAQQSWELVSGGVLTLIRQLEEAWKDSAYQAQVFRDIQDDYAKGAGIQYPSRIKEATDAQLALNAAMEATEARTRSLADALKGDLFKAYRDAAAEAQRLAEVNSLLTGGSMNPDWDRGEDWTRTRTAESRREG